MRADGLRWLPRTGLGYLPRHDPGLYDAGYFGKYLRMDASTIGSELTKIRMEQVQQHWAREVIDIGIGGGGFVKARQRQGLETTGYDVNEQAKAWLLARGAWRNPYEGETLAAATFWDSLEHIPDPGPLLARIHGWAFVSLPVYPSKPDERAELQLAPTADWRHYRPGEHLLYFTHRGVLAFMRWHGFECIQYHDHETQAGRLDIRSYSFLRTKRAPA